MKFLILLLLPLLAHAVPQSEMFIIQVMDRKMSVVSPDKERKLFSVLVENRSLSDQVARFETRGKLLKYISVPSGKSESVEIENTSGSSVTFVPVSPAFQEVELVFGKKAYEVPPKE
ncbi:MAG: hypothetical protein ACJ76H_03360 [Bacteriovoracaceae bacterium]